MAENGGGPVRVMLMPADRSGCGLYRMILPAKAVANAQPDWKIGRASGIMGEVSTQRDGKTVAPYVKSLPPLEMDVLVFQRPFDAIVGKLIPVAQAQGVACVVELDDDVRNLDPMNAAWGPIQPKNNPSSNWQHVVDACMIADWVTVSTPELARYAAPHGRVSVIENAVPLSMVMHDIPPRLSHSAPVTVGWAGSVGTHPNDLEETMGGVARAVVDTGAHFHVIGDGVHVAEGLRLPRVDGKHEMLTGADGGPVTYALEPSCTRCGQPIVDGVCASGWLPLKDYPEALTRLDVGIVPLSPHPFNRSKSFLKGLEMAALGIPFVASPLPEYVRLRDEYGIGIIAKRSAEWSRELTKLIRDHDYRNDLGMAYRQIVGNNLTTDHTAPEWSHAWASARMYRDSLNQVSAHG